MSSFASAAEPPEVRAAIERGLAFVAQRGADWIAERECVTCHQVPSMLWSLNDARARGYKLDSAKLDESSDFAFQYCVESKTKDKQPDGHGMSTVAQMLLGRDRNEDAKRREQLVTLADVAAKLQKEAGFWNPGGQPQRRPVPESNQVTTLWMTLAISSLSDSRPEWLAARDRANKWLATAKPQQGQSTEWWVARYLHAREFDPDKAESFLKGLLANQHDDGGWGWLLSEESDAFGTGLALYAMHYSGQTADDPAGPACQTVLICHAARRRQLAICLHPQKSGRQGRQANSQKQAFPGGAPGH